ncbi:antiviral helicase Ski2p [[Candida] anglica]|uniref:Antiviral helicase Ski2p n=1 Tax=[Candida] anglica TaxID=148631 RepID=A0ABP0EL02_9ASCO
MSLESRMKNLDMGEESILEDFIFEGLDPETKAEYQTPTSSIEVINAKLSKELLEPSNQLSWDLLDLLQDVPKPDHEKIYEDLMSVPQSIGRTSFRFKRSGITGDISGYNEELRLDEIDNATASNSLSVNRKFTPKSEANSARYLPFQPGGLVKQKTLAGKKDESSLLHRNDQGLFDIPQGFSRGLRVSGTDDEKIAQLEEETEFEDEEQSNTFEGEDGEEEIDGFVTSEIKIGNEPISSSVSSAPFSAEEIDGILPANFSNLKQNLAANKEAKRTWAHVVDLDHKLENFHDVVPNMAREWPFELDTFQQEAVYHLEQGDSVFVAAHTSAGKTVVAEYAIAMAARNMTKAIYTSPIKALSNQKFRDFKETFKDIDIGLITGDVQINPEANCLIMTTEILRSMLYRGADLIRDVEFVIFDEVHYVNDIDRGVVWEEVIIMLPDHVKYILLSATVPNTFEFANWVGRTKQKDIYVISTPKRPVPLEIFIWAKNELLKVIDSQRKFSDIEFKKHKEILERGDNKKPPNVKMGGGSRGGRGGSARGGNRGGGQVARGGRSGGNFNRDGPNKNTWVTLVQYLKGNNLLPAVIFVFSKKKCEEFANTLSSVDFCNAREKSEIHMFIDRAVSRLKKEDRELPQILTIRDMLSRGIAVHHGGLLPIVKECIEILFARTLVKVLFATETFAMGLNLPTRTVVFNTVRKHDGRGFRNLLPGEFTQMSGRAGRRGLDATGTVIVMSFNEPLSPVDFKEVTLGTPTKLVSQFRLTYNMILNLLRIEALRVEEMIKHSFSENSTQTLLPEHQTKVAELSKELEVTKVEPCSKCQLNGATEAYDLLQQHQKLYGQIIEEISKSPIGRTTLLRTGRMVVFRDVSTSSIKLGFIVRTEITTNSLLVLTFDSGENFEEDTKKYMIPWFPLKQYTSRLFPKMTTVKNLKVVLVPYENVNFLGRYALRVNIQGIIQNQKELVDEAIKQIQTLIKFKDKWEEIGFYQSTQLSLHELLEQKKLIGPKLLEIEAFNCDSFKTHYYELYKQDHLKSEIASLQRLISDENLELLPDYEQRLDVLQELGFIDHNHNVVLKGRVACEVNSGWELVVTELVLDNFLGDFEPEEIVALLSCFVYEGRTNEEEDPCITPRLERGKQRILTIVEKLMKVYTDNQVTLTSDEEEFLERKRFALVNVVYEWARGMSFKEIMEMSVEAEGTIVRVITRLDEICREVRNAALIVGDSTLHAKMTEAQERIKRDIVFCASLYL